MWGGGGRREEPLSHAQTEAVLVSFDQLPTDLRRVTLSAAYGVDGEPLTPLPAACIAEGSVLVPGNAFALNVRNSQNANDAARSYAPPFSCSRQPTARPHLHRHRPDSALRPGVVGGRA